MSIKLQCRPKKKEMHSIINDQFRQNKVCDMMVGEYNLFPIAEV